VVIQVRGLRQNPADVTAGPVPRREGPQGQGTAAWPWAAVTVAITWSLWELRATVQPAQFLNDSALHEQMVRSAGRADRGGA